MKPDTLPSRTAVKKAGRALHDPTTSHEDRSEARDIIGAFRSAHSYPLNAVAMNVRNKARETNEQAIIARRLKRLNTIVDKLLRYPTMNVSTMQDLGGCRVIMPSVGDVDALRESLTTSRRQRNKIERITDYLHESPKPDGYRGIHLVYQYGGSKKQYTNLRIEVQLRTELQHAWATAVETMDLFSGSRLKYGNADHELKRYFSLVSSLMADSEGTGPIPGADSSPSELRSELRSIEDAIGLLERLSGYEQIIRTHGADPRTKAIILELNTETSELQFSPYQNMSAARNKHAELESNENDVMDIVLVQLEKVSQLRKAYPNYFADTAAFTSFVRTELDN